MARVRRRNGRQSDELRPLQLQLNELARADGSARFGFGSSSAIASFSGPLEVRLGRDLPDRATLEITHRPLEGVGATSSRALESSLSTILPPLLALGQHPRSLIQLVVQTLSPSPQPLILSRTTTLPSSSRKHTWPPTPDHSDDEGSLDGGTQGDDDPATLTGIPYSARAAALNASVLAAVDAGSIPLLGSGVGVALAYLPSEGNERMDGDSGGTLVLDPDVEEEQRASSRFVFAWAFGAGMIAQERGGEENQGGMQLDDEGGGEAELIWVESEGSFSQNEFDEALTRSKVTAGKILFSIRSQLGDIIARRLGR